MQTTKFLWGPLFFIVFGIPISGDEYFYYFAIAFYFLFGILSNRNSGIIRISNRTDIYPGLMVLVWGFGVVNGLVRGNEIAVIVRNFAGTVCYLIYYVILNIKQDMRTYLSKTIIRTSILATALMILASFLYRTGEGVIWPLNNIRYNGYTLSVISSIGVLSFVLEAVCVWKILREQMRLGKKLIYIVLFIAATYALLIANEMGGFRLGYIVILWVSVLVSISGNRRHRWMILLYVMLLALTGLALFWDIAEGGIISNIFSTNDLGNNKRFFQIRLVFERFKMFGNGLGATYAYNIGRNYYGYSIETSYLDIVDKYGIFSLVLVYIYIMTFIRPIRKLRKNEEDPLHSLVVLGITGFFFVAAGNPVLFAPYNVFFHSIALYLIRPQGVETRKRRWRYKR